MWLVPPTARMPPEPSVSTLPPRPETLTSVPEIRSELTVRAGTVSGTLAVTCEFTLTSVAMFRFVEL